MSGPRVAIVASAHGFGHLTRQLAIGEALARRGATLTVFTAAPASVVAETLPAATVRAWAADAGVVQRDSVSEDLAETLATAAERTADVRIDALSRALNSFDQIVSDIPALALEAARRAGRPALAVGNFTWPWIYRRTPGLSRLAPLLEAWQAPFHGLQLWPGPGLEGFASVTPFGLVGRTRPAWRPPDRLRRVLVSFGGFGLDAIDALLPRIPGLRWVHGPPMARLARDDAEWVEGLPYPALVAGVDAVLSKPGYSILAEAALAGTPLAYVTRPAFPEAPFLEAAMQARGDLSVGTVGEDARAASVAAALEVFFSRPRPAPVAAGEADRIAAAILAA